MAYTKKDYENYLEKLTEINNFDWVKNHLSLKEIPNFWTILEYGEEQDYGKRSAYEIRTSRMLRWLMDANETHNLGNIFAHKVMKLIGVDYPHQAGKNKAIKTTAEEMDIDVFYKDDSKNIYIAIELKQYAKEGEYEDGTTQLDKYEKLVEEVIADSDSPITPYYIYLTPQKDTPSNDKWYAVGYGEWIEIIGEVLEEKLTESTDKYAADTRKILVDFKHDLQRSMDYSSKKNTEIDKLLSDEEKALTTVLADEIEHEINVKYLDELRLVNQDKLSDLEELILIAKKHIYAQDHSPNDKIRLLTRKIYNYLSAENQLDTLKLTNYNSEQTKTPIKKELIEKYNLKVDDVQITGGKGQGVFLINSDKSFRIYLSGDAKGNFPNDYVHLLPIPNPDKKRLNSVTLANRTFLLDEDFIKEGKIQFRNQNKSIRFDEFMTDHVMLAIKELSDKGLESL